MDLYSIYLEINSFLFNEFKSVISENDNIAPTPLRKHLTEKVEAEVEKLSKDNEMTELEKKVLIEVTKKRPKEYNVELVMGANKFVTVSNYYSAEKKFKNVITNLGTVSPKVII